MNGGPDQCPTSLLVHVVTVVARNVPTTTGSAPNIANNAIVSTTDNGERIQTRLMRSTTVQLGDGYAQRSSQPVPCVKHVFPGLLPPPSWITSYPSSTAERHSIGPTSSRSADHVTRVRARWRDRDGSACRGIGGEAFKPLGRNCRAAR